MFNLTDDELENSFQAIKHHGYSTLVPEPLEWTHICRNWDEIRAAIQKLDLDTYEPYKAMKIFAPKNRATIRIVHVLHPQDLIIYTALVLIVKNNIEKNRISKKNHRVFSYRVDFKKSNRLYDSKGAYDAYRDQLRKKGQKTSVKFVGLADIADFYPRIYQHRLENILETIARDERGKSVARVLVKKLIFHLMENNSYGIPVGPFASRVLAEAILIDIDAYLDSSNIDFVRWVDDYNIFCKSEYEAQATLFLLGERLFSYHGLTLQSAKTDIFTKVRFLGEILIKPETNLKDRNFAIALLRDVETEYEDELEYDEELDEDEIQETLEEIQSLDLLEMLEDSISDKTLVDYELANYVLTKLPRLTGALEHLKHKVLDLVIDNAELLYPLSEQIAKFVISFENLSPKEKMKIAKKLLTPLKSKRYSPPPFYAMWVLHVFTTSPDWNHAKDIINLYQRTKSEVIKRYAALAIGCGGTRAEARVIRDDFNSATDLLRLAILVASQKLGTDERKFWKRSERLKGVVEKII